MSVSSDLSDLNEPGLLDGNHAMRQALKVHAQARQNYARALRDFTEYILTGKLPQNRAQ